MKKTSTSILTTATEAERQQPRESTLRFLRNLARVAFTTPKTEALPPVVLN